MIIEMVARQIGEGRGRDGQAFGAILRQTMARRLERGVGDAFALEARHVGQEGDDVRRGEAGGHLVDRGRDAQRADGGGMMAQHPPQLAGQFHRAGLAVGAGDGDGHIGERREIACGEQREQAAGIVVGDMDRTIHPGFGPRHYRDGARAHGVGDEILPIHARSLKGAEDGAPRNLPVIDREARHHCIRRCSGIGLHIQPLDQRPEAHLNASPCPARAGA